MSTSKRIDQMSIGMNILGLGGHSAAWRIGEAPWSALQDVKYFQNIARISERGALDAIFLADGPALGMSVARQPAGRLKRPCYSRPSRLRPGGFGVFAPASPPFNGPFILPGPFA